MQRVKVHAMQFECNMCGKRYPNEIDAWRCFEVHSKAINQLIVKYKPGARIKAHYLHNSDFPEVSVVIIKTEGELTNFRVLVEDEDGSRWWEGIVVYQTGNSVSESIQNKPTNFWTWNPLIP